jgi:phage terminase small subunit
MTSAAVPDELLAIPAAVAEWNRVVPIYIATGVATELERGILIALCREWANYLTTESPIARKDSLVAYRQLCATMGDPCTRTKIQTVRPAEQENRFAGFLREASGA